MNWDLLGHDWAVDLLKGHIIHDDVRHAYLFCGPRGIGRRTLALRLAQALNCPNPPEPGVPCRSCRICRQIEKMLMADLFVVQAETEGGTLKVEQIRELEHSLALHPYEARYRVALLLRFEEAHLSAMNALLKTLEEPAPQVVILLTADSPENLLPTVSSRCETLRLRPLQLDALSAGLKSYASISDEKALLLAHVSGGKPGLAVRLAGAPALLEERTENLQELFWLMEADLVDRFERAESLSKEKGKLREKLVIWLSLWRDVVLNSADAAVPVMNLDFQDSVNRIAGHIDVQTARRMLVSIERTIDQIERNVNTRLALEVLMLDLPRINPVA